MSARGSILTSGVVLLLASISIAPDASADVYKYTKPDGSVVYTDNLAQLPKERREYYAKKKQEQEEKRREEEANLTPEERERRELEAKQAELLRQQKASADRERLLKELDSQLQMLRQRGRERDSKKAQWQQRMKTAKSRLKQLVDQHTKTRESFEQLAMQPDYTLLPGQADDKEKARASLETLEKLIDAQIEEIEEKLPEQARKEGIPPGWLRD